ncbi:MAG TPA: alkaline phosphatase family protein [Gammaproteobacteria bacterium]
MKPRPLVVLDVVGLTPGLVGADTPRLAALAAAGGLRPLGGTLPALTTSAQASMLTGLTPAGHGIVGNGWYFRDTAEVRFWLQPNALMGGEKVWEAARARVPGFTCAQLFWWYNMYAAVDWSVTPRPFYPADGRKLPALYSRPAELQAELEAELGAFPFFDFWGPRAGLPSSRWIAESARRVFDRERPTLTLVYLPHLDYDGQRLGPDHPGFRAALREIDAVAGDLVDHVRARDADVLVVSASGLPQATAPVHLNRALRAAGLLAVRVDPDGRELPDPGGSRAFAVADHQVAHVYVHDRADLPAVRALLAGLDGVGELLDGDGLRAAGLDHPRSGELLAVAAPGRWFTWYHWLDDARAPDYARTVDIHRKPGYDPCELFVDPALRAPKLRLATRLLQKQLGLRMLLDVIPLDAGLVRGTHGRLAADPADGALLIGSRAELLPERVAMTDLKALMLAHWSRQRPG